MMSNEEKSARSNLNRLACPFPSLATDRHLPETVSRPQIFLYTATRFAPPFLKVRMPRAPQQFEIAAREDRSASSRFVVPLLLVITICPFVGVLWCGFVNFDDPSYITDNSFVRAGLTLETIRWALTHRVQHLYHPLTSLSFALDAQVFGIEPAGFHLENLLLHCANAVFLYSLLNRLTGATWRSALVAALWAVHPLRVESVAWITERKDMLMAFFGLLSLRAYVDYVHRPSGWKYGLMCLLLVLSLLSKPTLMVMPALLLILDFWPLQRTRCRSVADETPTWRTLIVEKIPVAVLCILNCRNLRCRQPGRNPTAQCRRRDHAPASRRECPRLLRTLRPDEHRLPQSDRLPSHSPIVAALASDGIGSRARTDHLRRHSIFSHPSLASHGMVLVRRSITAGHRDHFRHQLRACRSLFLSFFNWPAHRPVLVVAFIAGPGARSAMFRGRHRCSRFDFSGDRHGDQCELLARPRHALAPCP
jgi:hypothetical protein